MMFLTKAANLDHIDIQREDVRIHFITISHKVQRIDTKQDEIWQQQKGHSHHCRRIRCEQS